MPVTEKKAGQTKGASGPKSLATYLDLIRNDPNEFRTVSRKINPMEFQVTAILENLERRGEFPVVEFTNPLNLHGEPSKFPILMNLWATRERCAEAIGLPRSKAGRELGAHFSERVPQKIQPLVVSSDNAPVHANVLQGEKADMWMLPGVRHAEMDLGAAFLMGMVAKPPGESFYNITFVKTFPETGRRGGLTPHSAHIDRIFKAWERRGERFPVINVLGHHPGFWLGTLNSTPWGDNEYATAGGFLQEPVRLAPSVTWGKDFMVPADAEIIIEGEISANERTVVDPFGEISGQYQPQEIAPLMEVTAITYRDNAIFQDIFSGHREHQLMGALGHAGSIYNFLNQKIGGVTAVNLPFSACGRYTVYISVNKTMEHQPKQLAMAALVFLPTLHIAVVVDDEIDVFNEEQVMWAVNTYVDPDRDVDIMKNLRPPQDQRGMGSNRVMLDATRPTHRPFPPRLRVPLEVAAQTKLEEWLDPVKGSKS